MKIRERPVYQVEVKIRKAKILQRLPARFSNAIVHVIPHLRRNPKILTLEVITLDESFEHNTDVLFIPVHRSTVDVPIARINCFLNRCRYRISANGVRAECP
jgi:hypothetical protein